jgi:hypothetical protein
MAQRIDRPIPPHRPLGQRLIVAVMLLAIGLPLVLTVIAHAGPRSLGRWINGHPLHDNAVAPRRPHLRTAAWWRGQYQRELEAWFARNLALRARIVRLTNQAYYSIFSKSYMYDRQIVIGRDRQLYEASYLSGYCRALGPPETAAITSLVARLSQLRDRLESNGRSLVFLLTPSKTATMPEFLPAGLCGGPSEPDRIRSQFVESIRDAHIVMIDGPSLVRDMKRLDPLPPFLRGSTHWSVLAGARVSQKVVEAIGRLWNRDIGAIVLDTPRWDAPPRGTDADLVALLNLWRPPLDYRAGTVERECRPTAEGQHRRLVAVGGSFLEEILEPIGSCRLFGAVQMFFYLDQMRVEWVPERRPFPPDPAALSWGHLLDDRTMLLVEMNENLIGYENTHVHRLVDSVLTGLPRSSQ